MTYLARILFVPALLGTALASERASAAVLDWNSVNWVEGTDRDQTFTNVNGSGIDVRVQILGDVSRLVTTNTTVYGDTIPGAPSDVNILQGGLATRQESLFIKVENLEADELIRVRVTFLQTGTNNGASVTGVQIPIFDLDAAVPGSTTHTGTYIDNVETLFYTTTGGSTASPNNPTSIVTNDANTPLSANTVEGILAAHQFAGDGFPAGQLAHGEGTATFNHAAGLAIQRFEIEYRNTWDDDDHGIQWIGISDITFFAIPEPSTYAMLGLVTAAGGFYTWRKRKKTAPVSSRSS